LYFCRQISEEQSKDLSSEIPVTVVHKNTLQEHMSDTIFIYLHRKRYRCWNATGFDDKKVWDSGEGGAIADRTVGHGRKF